jgi:hypothetical protein
MDVQDIAPGQDFTEAIDKTISGCPAVVVVIGPRWVADLKQRGNNEDFVRQEVSTALRRRAAVIPVLVGGATMPSASELPESLAALSRRQAVEIRDARFDDDVKLLVGALQKVRGVAPVTSGLRRKTWLWIALAAMLVVVIGAGAFWWMGRRGPDVSGIWIADMQKPGRRPFRVRLELMSAEGELTGSVHYPTGDGTIQNGKLVESRLTFFTTHTPQFGSEPVTIRWNGTIDGNLIRFNESDDSGVAHGVAHRRAAP